MSATITSTPSRSLRERTLSASHIGRNSGYFSMSATSANMRSGEWRTWRTVSCFGIARAAQAADASFFSRAALSRAKSSPAWCDERVSGEAETMRKPFV